MPRRPRHDGAARDGNAIQGSSNSGPTESARAGDAPITPSVALVPSELSAKLVGAATPPGASKSWTFSAKILGGAVVATCTITGSATSCSTTTAAATVPPLSQLVMEIVAAGSPPGVPVAWSLGLRPA